VGWSGFWVLPVGGVAEVAVELAGESSSVVVGGDVEGAVGVFEELVPEG
jgi:hypothetical protein